MKSEEKKKTRMVVVLLSGNTWVVGEPVPSSGQMMLFGEKEEQEVRVTVGEPLRLRAVYQVMCLTLPVSLGNGRQALSQDLQLMPLHCFPRALWEMDVLPQAVYDVDRCGLRGEFEGMISGLEEQMLAKRAADSGLVATKPAIEVARHRARGVGVGNDEISKNRG